MNFIKKVFNDETDESVHLQFQKFGRGEFRNKALIEIKNSGGKFTIKTSAEFSNELVREVAKKLGEAKTQITGAVISTGDLTGEIEFKNKKQFQGVKKYLIDDEMSGIEIINLLNKFPKNFFALSFSAENYTLKIKPKAPKSGKPGKGDETPKVDFCTLKTSDSKIVKEFIFEKDNFKEAKIEHTFFIDEIIQPKGEIDYAKIREFAKRKGRIIRNATIDGEKTKTEKEFVA